MDYSIKHYKELSSIQNSIVDLQIRVQRVIDTSVHQDIKLCALHFKHALIKANLDMTESLFKIDF